MDMQIVVTEREPAETDPQLLGAVLNMWAELLVEAVVARPDHDTTAGAAHSQTGQGVGRK